MTTERVAPKKGVDIWLTYKSGREEQKNFPSDNNQKFKAMLNDARASKETGHVTDIEIVRAPAE